MRLGDKERLRDLKTQGGVRRNGVSGVCGERSGLRTKTRRNRTPRDRRVYDYGLGVCLEPLLEHPFQELFKCSPSRRIVQ